MFPTRPQEEDEDMSAMVTCQSYAECRYGSPSKQPAESTDSPQQSLYGPYVAWTFRYNVRIVCFLQLKSFWPVAHDVNNEKAKQENFDSRARLGTDVIKTK